MWPSRLLCPWDSPGVNTEVGCHFLLHGALPTQGSNSSFLRLLHGRAGSLPLVPPAKQPYILMNNSRHGVAKKNIPFCLTLLLWFTGTLSFGRLKGFNSKKTSGPKSTSLGNFNFSCCTLKEKPYVVAHGKATSESWGHLNPALLVVFLSSKTPIRLWVQDTHFQNPFDRPCCPQHLYLYQGIFVDV